MSKVILTPSFHRPDRHLRLPAFFLEPYGDTYKGSTVHTIDDMEINDKSLALVPLDSCVKGPLYTVVPADTLLMTAQSLGARIEIGYTQKDTPPHKSLTASFDFVNAPLSRFLVSPYIYSLNQMGEYNCNTRFGEREITILDFSIMRRGWGNYVEAMHYDNQIALTKFLKQNSLNTVTVRFFKIFNSDLIDSARITIVPNERFHCNFVNIPGTEVCFAVSMRDWKRLTSYERVEIEIYRTATDSGDVELVYQYPALDIWQILRACIFLPDLFYFDSSFYREELSYRINAFRNVHDEPSIIDVSYVTEHGQRQSIYYSLVNMPK